MFLCGCVHMSKQEVGACCLLHLSLSIEPMVLPEPRLSFCQSPVSTPQSWGPRYAQVTQLVTWVPCRSELFVFQTRCSQGCVELHWLGVWRLPRLDGGWRVKVVVVLVVSAPAHPGGGANRWAEGGPLVFWYQLLWLYQSFWDQERACRRKHR